MARTRALFFTFFVATLALFASWHWVSALPHEIGSVLAILHPCLFVAGVACAAGTWGTAVAAASVHRVIWPLVTAMLSVVAGMALAVWSWTR